MALSTALRLALCIAPIALLGACAGTPGPVGNAAVPQPAKAVELDRYLGKWFEMARYEAPFQKGCDGVTAEYALREDGRISVVNSCTRDGKTNTANGKAKIVEGSGNAKLKVSFFGPFTETIGYLTGPMTIAGQSLANPADVICGC